MSTCVCVSGFKYKDNHLFLQRIFLHVWSWKTLYMWKYQIKKVHYYILYIDKYIVKYSSDRKTESISLLYNFPSGIISFGRFWDTLKIDICLQQKTIAVICLMAVKESGLIFNLYTSKWQKSWNLTYSLTYPSLGSNNLSKICNQSYFTTHDNFLLPCQQSFLWSSLVLKLHSHL